MSDIAGWGIQSVTIVAERFHAMMTIFQVKMRFPALFCAILVLLACEPAGAREEPSVAQIMSQARLVQRSQNRVFRGKLRNEDRVIPFRLTLRGDLIRYDFVDGRPPLVLKLGNRGTTLEEAGDTVRGSRLKDRIDGTDISYEDLAMKFLFWEMARLEGERIIIAGRKSWQISLLAPRGGNSNYAVVRVWVDQGSGALTRMEGYDRTGKLIKRFEVRNLQKLDDGSWALKQMRIQAMDGARSADRTPTYLELRD
jgi:hypothetical protein